MASLGSQTPAATFGDLLQISNSNSGVDTTLRAVSDGQGTNSALELSTTNANIAGTFDIGTTTEVTAILDEDAMSSNSATALATQQSIKAYVDASGAVLLETQTASTSSSIDFTSGIDGTYKEYVIKGVGIRPATDGANFYFRASTDGGSSFLGGTNYTFQLDFTIAGTTSLAENSAGTSQIAFMDTVGNATTDVALFQINIGEPSSSANYKAITAQAAWGNTSGVAGVGNASGLVKTATAIDAVQILANTGNITSGTFKLYGIS